MKLKHTTIEIATKEDFDRVIEIFNEAKSFIKSTGSPQWQTGNPNSNSFASDINSKSLYKVSIDGNIEAIFFISDNEHTYDIIYEGHWGFTTFIVLHRVAISNKMRGKGLFKDILEFSYNYATSKNIDGIRIDTHEKNEAMKKSLLINGFKYCGIIHLNNKDDYIRLAYEKDLRNGRYCKTKNY